MCVCTMCNVGFYIGRKLKKIHYLTQIQLAWHMAWGCLGWWPPPPPLADAARARKAEKRNKKEEPGIFLGFP